MFERLGPGLTASDDAVPAQITRAGLDLKTISGHMPTAAFDSGHPLDPTGPCPGKLPVRPGNPAWRNRLFPGWLRIQQSVRAALAESIKNLQPPRMAPYGQPIPDS